MLHVSCCVLQLVRAQVLLKKEPQYPYAWKPHKAYLYSNGVLIFVHHDAKADKAGAQDAELSGESPTGQAGPIFGVDVFFRGPSGEERPPDPADSVLRRGPQSAPRASGNKPFCKC